MLNQNTVRAALPSSTSTSVFQRPRTPSISRREDSSLSNQLQNIKQPNLSSQIDNFLKRNKNSINKWTNYSSAITCGASFIISNANVPEILKAGFRQFGFGLTSLATTASGIVNAHSGIKGKNILATIGAAAEIPTSIAAIGKNLWLFRGIPLFGQNQQLIFSNLEARDKNNERTTGVKLDTTFKNIPGIKGFWKGLTIMIGEMPHIIHDFIKDPKKTLKSSPQVVFLSTTSQLVGAIAALFGHEKVGAAFRNIGAVGVDAGCALHQSNEKKVSKLKGLSDYFLAGIIWGGAAVIDFFKRFDFISDKIAGLSELEYTLDRFATAFFNSGNDKAANANKKLAA